MKKILITGAGSYIGTSFETYMKQWTDEYHIDTVDTVGEEWKSKDFSEYDVVFHVAGIAHRKETSENAHLYYAVNRDLTVDVANKAKNEGVNQFILLSSMSVYSVNNGRISKFTVPHPTTHYGKSKLQADRKISKLRCNSFKVVILRPPMVYGKNCKGNYQSLRTFALKSPVFPKYLNARSMVYIGNLCEFVKQCIDVERNGLYFPQNAEYTNTSRMVELIARENNKAIKLIELFNVAIDVVPLSVVKKVFGTLVYEQVDTINKYSFEESVRLSEQ